MNENAIGKEVVEAAVQVHRELGPGCFEAVDEVVDGFPQENLCVLASWREKQIRVEPRPALDSADTQFFHAPSHCRGDSEADRYGASGILITCHG